MATATQIPLKTYLATAYEPDMEYVDGRLEDRAIGEYDHNLLQRAILFWFYQRERAWNVRCIQEQRVRVAAEKVRIPDVCVFARELVVEQVFTRLPMIAVEVLSPEDRPARMDAKIKDYLAFGIRHVWVLDPRTREAWDCSTGEWIAAERLMVDGSAIHLAVVELFAQVDEEKA